MNRTIKFRGLRNDGNGWAYGAFVPSGVNPYDIIIDGKNEYAVNPETVGQFTGLTDRNGKEIWEGSKTPSGWRVKWDDVKARWYVDHDIHQSRDLSLYLAKQMNFSSNIHEQ
jgi:hypothetical protein